MVGAHRSPGDVGPLRPLWCRGRWGVRVGAPPVRTALGDARCAPSKTFPDRLVALERTRLRAVAPPVPGFPPFLSPASPRPLLPAPLALPVSPPPCRPPPAPAW